MACVLVLSLRVSGAGAQAEQETALARALFEEGVSAADEGRWAEAADRFGRAHSLKPTPATAFNWASALIELGQLVQAGERLRAITSDEIITDELRAESQEKLDALTPRLAALVVTVEQPNEDLAVVIDERPLPRVAWGAGAPMDPGMHTVALMRGTEMLVTESVTLADGERQSVLLSAPQQADNTPARAVVTLGVPVRERRPLYKSWALWTSVGAVAIAGILTAVLLGRDDANEPEPVQGNTDPAVIRW